LKPAGNGTRTYLPTFRVAVPEAGDFPARLSRCSSSVDSDLAFSGVASVAGSRPHPVTPEITPHADASHDLRVNLSIEWLSTEADRLEH
jgi:hypothetical protein